MCLDRSTPQIRINGDAPPKREIGLLYTVLTEKHIEHAVSNMSIG